VRRLVTLTFESAGPGDLDIVRSLLSESNLPTEDVAEHVAEFVLARWEGVTVGTVAVEYGGQAALLRSLCVAPSQRNRAVGARLLAAIEAKVASRGVRELYLLTTSAEGFFERHGFSRSARADAPPGVRGTAQFLSLCPSTAVCMRKTLRGGETNEQTRTP
jgi:N-acetylglutamate synthase-like GNAT family acetyltransferase